MKIWVISVYLYEKYMGRCSLTLCAYVFARPCLERGLASEFSMETRKILYLAYFRLRLEFDSFIRNPTKMRTSMTLDQNRSDLWYTFVGKQKRCWMFQTDFVCRQMQHFTICLHMFACAVFVHKLADSFISSKVRTPNMSRSLRGPWLVVESNYQHNYLFCQPWWLWWHHRFRFRRALIKKLTDARLRLFIFKFFL